MSDRTRYLGHCAALLCLTVGGCAAPYTYYGDGRDMGPSAPYNELSGRYSDGGTAPCASCDERVAVDPATHTLTGLLHGMVTCNDGCSDLYWGEWAYDPPDDCDPCNNHGDWTGPRCCPPGGWLTFWQGLHGRRMGTCDDGGCTDYPAAVGPTFDEPFSEPQYEPSPPDGLPPMPAVEPPPESAGQAARATLPYYSRDPNSRLTRRTRR